LLLDEDPSVLDVMGTILRGRNHVVHKASTLADAKSVLKRQECDVIVADMQIAENTEHTGLSEWLKANQPALLHRLVWMRASAPSGAAQEKARAAAPVLQKPFRAGELLAVVESLLSDVHSAPIER
jgi:DNA-binding NtrC family response regulator